MEQALKAEYHAIREQLPPELRLRVHRAISRLEKAAAERDDLDMGFIALWIGFNAIYAKETLFNSSDKQGFRLFIHSICQFEPEATYNLVWSKYSSSIRLLLDNRYVFQPFWDFHNGLYGENAWLEDFEEAKKRSHRALANKDTAAIINIVCERLYTLRNQVFHGGATYNSKANRDQLHDAYAFLLDFVALCIRVLLNHPETDWGKPFYPYVPD